MMKEVILFEGFFNRLNGLVSGRLIHGSEFRACWALNAHVPHRFSELFEALPGVEIKEVKGLESHHQNTNPANGPLCYFFLNGNIIASLEEVAETYKWFISYIKISNKDPECRLGIHYRGFHRGSVFSVEEFCDWCASQALARVVDKVYVLADCRRDMIFDRLSRNGLEVRWGDSPAMDGDLDRENLPDFRAFISDALTLSMCDTILCGFDETTIVDPARAFGREIVSFQGNRGWSECWFERRGLRSGRRS